MCVDACRCVLGTVIAELVMCAVQIWIQDITAIRASHCCANSQTEQLSRRFGRYRYFTMFAHARHPDCSCAFKLGPACKKSGSHMHAIHAMPCHVVVVGSCCDRGSVRQGWRLVITGHSLGAGAATLLALKLRDNFKGDPIASSSPDSTAVCSTLIYSAGPPEMDFAAYGPLRGHTTPCLMIVHCSPMSTISSSAPCVWCERWTHVSYEQTA